MWSPEVAVEEIEDEVCRRQPGDEVRSPEVKQVEVALAIHGEPLVEGLSGTLAEQ